MANAYILGFVLVAYVVLSTIVRRQERVLGIVRSKELRKAIWIGILWINGPVLPLMLFPLFLLRHFAPASGVLVWSVILLLGFLISWAWWSVNVSLWRRWAKRRGIDPEQLQDQGQSSSLLWPKGHFFERTEYDRLRGRDDA
jgi:hypothetical protein